MTTGLYLKTATSASAREAIENWKRTAPNGGCFVLVAEKHKNDIADLQKLFNAVDYPCVGAVFPQLIANGDFEKEGYILFHYEQFPFYKLVENIPADSDSVVTAIATELHVHLKNTNDEYALFSVFDGMLPNIASVLDRLYLELSNRVHYFGVNAGSETFQPMPCLFDNQQFVGNGVLLMLIPKHTGAVLSHNYRQPETQLVVTSTEGNRIDSIEWQPAFEMYKNLVSKHYNVDITAETFYQYGVHFPFGIIRADGEPLVRIPVALKEDGSLYCVGEVPANSMLTLLEAIEDGKMDTIETVVRKLPASHSQTVIGFYCAGRRMHLGDGTKKELKMLETKLSDKKLLGALSLGEIGSSTAGGYPLFHNAAIVLANW